MALFAVPFGQVNAIRNRGFCPSARAAMAKQGKSCFSTHSYNKAPQNSYICQDAPTKTIRIGQRKQKPPQSRLRLYAVDGSKCRATQAGRGRLAPGFFSVTQISRSCSHASSCCSPYSLSPRAKTNRPKRKALQMILRQLTVNHRSLTPQPPPFPPARPTNLKSKPAPERPLS